MMKELLEKINKKKSSRQSRKKRTPTLSESPKEEEKDVMCVKIAS